MAYGITWLLERITYMSFCLRFAFFVGFGLVGSLEEKLKTNVFKLHI